jgi:hypothetical protein
MKDLAKIILTTDGALGVRRVIELKNYNIITAQDFVEAWEKDKFNAFIEKQKQEYIEADNRQYPEARTKDRRIFAKRKALRINTRMYKYIKELHEAYEHYSGKTVPDIEKPGLNNKLYIAKQKKELKENEKWDSDSDKFFKYSLGINGNEIKATFRHKVNHSRLSKYQRFTNKAVLYCEACNTISCIEIEKAEELAKILLGQQVQISFKKNYFYSKFCKFCDSQQMEVVIKKIEARYDNTSLKKLKKRYQESVKKMEMLDT